MSQYDSPEFKALQKEWYAKLAASKDKDGEVFKDIEDTTRMDKPLKAHHNNRFKSIPIESRLATEAYYEQASSLLRTYKFENRTHKRIWELHCQGLSRRKIAIKIKHLTPTYGQARVGEIITEIASSFKAKGRGEPCKS